MPKKTRREKIISQLRRQLQAQSAMAISPKNILPQKTKTQNTSLEESNFHYSPLQEKSVSNKLSTAAINHEHVLSDLKRITGISLLAVFFEIILYLLLNMNGADKILNLIKR